MFAWAKEATWRKGRVSGAGFDECVGRLTACLFAAIIHSVVSWSPLDFVCDVINHVGGYRKTGCVEGR